MKTVKGYLDYVGGHLRYGHFEAKLADDEYEAFCKMSKDDQIDYLFEAGELIIDDFEVNEYGDMTEIET